MADICNRCGKRIDNDLNKETFERDSRKMVELHLNCNEEEWDEDVRKIDENI